MDGEVVIKPLAPGKYDVKGVYVGYQPYEIKGVVIGEGKTAYVVLPLSNGEGVKLDEVEVVSYQVPLVDPDIKQDKHLPVKNIITWLPKILTRWPLPQRVYLIQMKRSS